MSTFAERFENVFRRVLPSPLSIALCLTAIAFFTALLFAPLNSETGIDKVLELALIWQEGLWQSNLLAFTVQMMLILVLGHTLALSPPITRLIDRVSNRIHNGTQAAVWVGILTMLVALFNWGLGLIFGAILARKVAESAHRRNLAISYPLVGAAGYSGLMVWHGGLSGSAPLKANESGHLYDLIGEKTTGIPGSVPLQETLFSPMNLFASVLVILISALLLWGLSRIAVRKVPFAFQRNVHVGNDEKPAVGAEHLDRNRTMGWFWGILILGIAAYLFFGSDDGFTLFTPNYVNFILLGLAFTLHGSLNRFTDALGEAISGSAGILIQFPLYFGIMAIVRDSGLVNEWAQAVIAGSSAESFPFATLASAGIINIFVPSGGGQWAIQGPLLIEASQALGIPLGKSIMAMSYGDQLTNMLQPFWALPLLGVTQLKARDILPYTLILMIAGIAVYSLALALF